MDTGKAVPASSVQAVGWRVWTVQERPEGLRLGSVIHDAVWTPGVPGVATCSLEFPHAAPAPDCTCGFHAARDPVDAFSYLYGRNEPRTIGRVLGEVLLLGRVVEMERGWRASESYPLRLYLDDPELAVALATYGVPVLSPGWGSAIATSSKTDSAGSPKSSYNAALTRSSQRAASG